MVSDILALLIDVSLMENAYVVFITASEYFAKRFADTPYAETFQNYFSTSFTATNLALFGLLLWRQSNVSARGQDIDFMI